MNEENQSFLFGVSQYTTWHQSFEEDIDVYSKLGVGAIEICEFKLNPSRIAEQFQLVTQSGLKVTSVQAKVHTVYPDTLESDPKSPQKRMALLRESVESIALHIPKDTPFIVNTGAAPDGNLQDGWELATRELREFSDFAAGFGMRVAIEPLNPTDNNRNTFIWQIPRAMDLIRDVARSNFGICIDTWNIWQDPLAAEHIAECGDKIFAVQLSDWKLPRVYADRHIVGEGVIPFPELLSAIRSTGYSGGYTLEIFSPDSLPDSLWKADPRHVIGKSLSGINRVWKQSFS